MSDRARKSSPCGNGRYARRRLKRTRNESGRNLNVRQVAKSSQSLTGRCANNSELRTEWLKRAATCRRATTEELPGSFKYLSKSSETQAQIVERRHITAFAASCPPDFTARRVFLPGRFSGPQLPMATPCRSESPLERVRPRPER